MKTRLHGALAAAAAPHKATPKRKYSASALTAQKAVRADLNAAIDDAVAWCKRTGKGAKAAVAHGKKEGVWQNVTYNHLHPRLKGKISNPNAKPRSHHKQVLTDEERRQLSTWCLACADGGKPKDHAQITTKIKELLRARLLANRAKARAGGAIKLNEAERDVLNRDAVELSKRFFQDFYAWCRARGIEIETGKTHNEDEKRAAKMTEATVERHFHGEFGLEAELVDAGIMDPETKVRFPCPISSLPLVHA